MTPAATHATAPHYVPPHHHLPVLRPPHSSPSFPSRPPASFPLVEACCPDDPSRGQLPRVRG
eukprot:8929910-Pyramimonas_sp.AAC.1